MKINKIRNKLNYIALPLNGKEAFVDELEKQL